MDQRTVGYCANQESGKIFLLRKVQPGWDLWSVGTIGPGCFGRVRHDSDVCVAGGIAMKGEWGEEGKRGKRKGSRSSLEGREGGRWVINV